MRPAFQTALIEAAGGDGSVGDFLPEFVESEADSERVVAGHRPYGVAGEHLRRSNVARYRDDVAVCRTLEEALGAVATFGPQVVIKEEFTSSGRGVRVCEGPMQLQAGEPLEKWLGKCLRRDGVVTVEPWMEIIVEFSAEWIDGKWNGLSQCMVENLRWQGQWLGDPRERMSLAVYEWVYEERAVERMLERMDVPGTCGAATCGVDVAIVPKMQRVREPESCSAADPDAHSEFEIRIMELNARTTMSHYAVAAKRVHNQSGVACDLMDQLLTDYL